MKQLYRFIEQKIKASGYPEHVDGAEFYHEIAKEAWGKEEGSYLFMVKWENDVWYEGRMDVLEDQFDLHTVDIHTGEKVYHVDFDA